MYEQNFLLSTFRNFLNALVAEAKEEMKQAAKRLRERIIKESGCVETRPRGYRCRC